jgi:hypothetical protein
MEQLKESAESAFAAENRLLTVLKREGFVT